MRQHQGKKTAWGGQESRAGGNKGGGNRGRPPRPPATNVMCAPSTAVVPGPPARVGCDDRHCGGKKQVSRAPPPPSLPNSVAGSTGVPTGGGADARTPRAPPPKVAAPNGPRTAQRCRVCPQRDAARGHRPVTVCTRREGWWGGGPQGKGLLHANQLAAVGKAHAEDLSEPQPRPRGRAAAPPLHALPMGTTMHRVVEAGGRAKHLGVSSVRCYFCTHLVRHGSTGARSSRLPGDTPPPTPRNRRSAQVVHAARGRQAP